MVNMYRMPFAPTSSRLAAILGEEPDLLSMASTSDVHLTDATIPIPEEDSIMSEGFQGDRIQVAVRLRPLHKNAGDTPSTTTSSRPKPSLLYLPRRSSQNKTSSTVFPPLLPSTSNSTSSNTSTTDDGCNTSTACKSSAWTIVNKDTLVLKGPGRKTPNKNQFTVDHVFDETMDTRSIYAEMARPIIQATLTGRHGTLFAYGQTGSGKTYTLQGNTVTEPNTKTTTSSAADEGLIQLAMSDLFHAIDASTSRDWEVKVQYFEIYNEEVHDLLAATPPESSVRNPGRTRGFPPLSSWTNSTGSCRSSRGGKNRHPTPIQSSSPPSPSRTRVRLPTLKILEDKHGTAHVSALEKGVTSAEECVRLLRKGNRARAMAATDSNQHSSRSHAIFRVSLQSRPKQNTVLKTLQSQHSSIGRNQGGGANLSLSSISSSSSQPPPQLNEPTTTTAASTRWSVLNFVDLAGSENGGRALGSAAASSNTGHGYSHHNNSSSNNKSTLVRRQREGAKINQSLLSLSRVIYALSLDDDKRPAHIGYRDSKLTRILQPSLSGNAAMAILCCASLSKADINETRSTLKFATSAKQIPIQPMVNEVLLHDPSSMAAAAAAAAVANNSMALVAEKDAAVSRLQKELVTVKQTLREFQEQFQVFHDFSSSIHKQQEQSPQLPPPVLFSKPLVVGRIMDVASGGDSRSMGSSEETLTFPPPNGKGGAEKGSGQQEKPREHLPDADGIVIVRTPGSPSPLSPPLLPRRQEQNERTISITTTGTTPPRGATIDHGDDDKNNSIYPPPPLTEVEISPQPTTSNNPDEKNNQLMSSEHVMALDEQRANYLEERIEITESLVENIFSELHLTRRAMQEAKQQNSELHKQVLRLQREIARILGHDEEDVDEEEEDDGDDSLGRSIKSVLGTATGERGPMAISGWYFLVCIILYAFGLRDLFLSAIIFLWLSLQMVK